MSNLSDFQCNNVWYDNVQYNIDGEEQMWGMLIGPSAWKGSSEPNSKLNLGNFQDLKPMHVAGAIIDSMRVSPVSLEESSHQATPEQEDIDYLPHESNHSSSSKDSDVQRSYAGSARAKDDNLNNARSTRDSILPVRDLLIRCIEQNIPIVDFDMDENEDYCSDIRSQTPISAKNSRLGGEVLDDNLESGQPKGYPKEHVDDVAHQQIPILNRGSPGSADILDVQRVYVRSVRAEADKPTNTGLTSEADSSGAGRLKRCTKQLLPIEKDENRDSCSDHTFRSRSHTPNSEKNSSLGGEVLDDNLKSGQPKGYLKEHVDDIAQQPMPILNSGSPGSADPLIDASSLQEDINNKEESLPQIPSQTASPASPQKEDSADSFPIVEMEKSKDPCSCCCIQ